MKKLSNSQHVAANAAEPTVIVVQNSLPQVVTLLSAAVTVIVCGGFHRHHHLSGLPAKCVQTSNNGRSSNHQTRQL